MKVKTLHIFSLTDEGRQLAERLQQQINTTLTASYNAVHSHKPKPFSTAVARAFSEGQALVFICATGIVVRTLAPLLQDKYSDPAVLVLDESGQFVIPLLSGHQGGANQLAAQVATLLSAQLVSTTAKPYREPQYTAGMGCERGCSKLALQQLLTKSLQQVGLALNQLSAISSIDIKADEVGLIELAAELNLPFICYDKYQLAAVESQLQTPSQYVFDTVGVYGVAESAALVCAAAQGDGEAELMLAKQKSAVATCAFARSYAAAEQI